MALVTSSASSSSNSTPPPQFSYDVFLSFRGEDTRKTFTDHLYTALTDAGFRTFRDDDELPRGEDIKPELQKAIQQSRSSVVVFSKDYASSGWCLDELVMILERKKTSNHVVLPVFYDIDPSHLRKQTGSVGKAFAEHQKKQSPEKLNKWKEALAQVADLGGMVLQNQADGHESKFIKKIVEAIEHKLCRVPLSVTPYLIEIQYPVKYINFWLQDGSSDVGMCGICGVGGIGKTTIAKVVYNSNFVRFEGSSFIENVREISKQPNGSNGLVQIQKQLLSDILNGRKVKIQSVSQGKTKIKDVIGSKKVLLVLDDVDHMCQLDAVLSMRDCFCPGSKIIITTRHAELLRAPQVDKVQIAQFLDDVQSLELFSWHSFGQDHPVEGYEEVSERVVHHCGGLPLALQTLGSSLSGQSLDVWESALNKLKAIPHSEVLSKLRISYDSLPDDHDKNLFLHIACFFIGKEKDVIVRILDGCDFYTIVGIQNLVDRCLVTIDEENRVTIHQMIRDMGREIVRLESKEPGKRSRLWHHKDSFHTLRENNGSEAIEGLSLNMYHVRTTRNSHVVLETNAFTSMHRLRILELCDVQLNGSYQDFPKGLRWLYWSECPLDSIPNDLVLENLVVLEMQYGSLKQVWKGTKHLPSLKTLDLSHSRGLTETGDLSLVPNLERLILVGCASLVGVHESIGKLEKLVYLNMKDCKVMRKLPDNITILKFLETLIISGCSNLNEFPMQMSKMESLKVLQADSVPINQLLITATGTGPGKSLNNYWTLPSTLVHLSLRDCNLSDDDFPRDFGNLSSLKYLDLGFNPIGSLPDCVGDLKGLVVLKMQYGSLKEVWKGTKHLPSLKTLDLSHCHGLTETDDFSLVPNLERLILVGCASLVGVHESIGKLEKLVYLNMKDCKVMRKLPDNITILKFREPLIISGCSNLNVFPLQMSKMESLRGLQAVSVPLNPFLMTATLTGTGPGKSLNNYWSCSPSTLVDLSLINCNLSDDGFPRDFGNLPSLKKLSLRGIAICGLPDCIRGLKRLDYLGVGRCTNLKSLIRLPRVRELEIYGCESLETVTFQSLSCLPERIGLFNDGPSQIVKIEHWYKLEAIGRVDVEMINLLGLCNLEPIKMQTSGDNEITTLEIQGLYEYGIFSTFFPGTVNEVPSEFSHSSSGELSISFTVPLLSNHRIRGLNIYCVYYYAHNSSEYLWLLPRPIIIIVRNKSKCLKWIYSPLCHGIPSKDEQDMIWLSLWKLGNQLEAGDQVTASLYSTHTAFEVKKWGIRIVHEEEDKMSRQLYNSCRRDANCYDGQDHPDNDVNEEVIGIGGHLSDLYQIMPGTYFFYGGPMEQNIQCLANLKTFVKNFIGESDEETDEEGIQQAEPDRMLAAAEAEEKDGISKYGGWRGRGCKVLIMAALFYFSVSLFSQTRKRQPTAHKVSVNFF